MSGLLEETLIPAVTLAGAAVSIGYARRSRRAWQAMDLWQVLAAAQRAGNYAGIECCPQCRCHVREICDRRLWEYFPPLPLDARCPCRAAAAASGISGLLRLVRIRREVRGRGRGRRRSGTDSG